MYEPDKAYRNGVDGKATLRCRESPTGELSDCSVVSESPTGFNFGDASLKLVKRGALNQPRQAGEAAREVRFDVPFTLPAEMHDAVNQTYFEALDAMGEGRSADAIEALNGAIRKQPNFAPAWNARARAFYRAGRLAEAVADLDKVLQLKAAYRPRLRMYSSDHKQMFSEMDVDFAAALLLKAEIETKLGDQADAATDYRRALAETDAEMRQFGGSRGFAPRALFEKGVIEQRLGEQAAGDADIASALASNPKIAEAMATLDVKP
jgi:tetratricopeptide (TPR) repeat protein